MMHVNNCLMNGGSSMESRTYLFPQVVALLMGVALLGACAMSPVSTAVQRVQPAQQTPIVTIAPEQSPVQPPQTLQSIEASAEDIIDFVPNANWSRVIKDVDRIATDWQAYLSQQGNDAPTVTKQALENALMTLTREAKAQNALATMQAANDVSAAVVELFDLYHPAIPADLGRLDVYGRQVILDVQMNDIAAAQNSLHQEENVWLRLKSDIEAHGGAQVATQYTTNLEQQVEAIRTNDATALVATARVALDLVDAMEQLY